MIGTQQFHLGSQNGTQAQTIDTIDLGALGKVDVHTPRRPVVPTPVAHLGLQTEPKNGSAAPLADAVFDAAIETAVEQDADRVRTLYLGLPAVERERVYQAAEDAQERAERPLGGRANAYPRLEFLQAFLGTMIDVCDTEESVYAGHLQQLGVTPEDAERLLDAWETICVIDARIDARAYRRSNAPQAVPLQETAERLPRPHEPGAKLSLAEWEAQSRINGERFLERLSALSAEFFNPSGVTPEEGVSQAFMDEMPALSPACKTYENCNAFGVAIYGADRIGADDDDSRAMDAFHIGHTYAAAPNVAPQQYLLMAAAVVCHRANVAQAERGES